MSDELADRDAEIINFIRHLPHLSEIQFVSGGRLSCSTLRA
jgi:hypothetical protein